MCYSASTPLYAILSPSSITTDGRCISAQRCQRGCYKLRTHSIIRASLKGWSYQFFHFRETLRRAFAGTWTDSSTKKRAHQSRCYCGCWMAGSCPAVTPCTSAATLRLCVCTLYYLQVVCRHAVLVCH